MALIKCVECGKEISDKAISCPNCGCPISEIREESEVTDKKYCAKCGSIMKADGIFCNQCGFNSKALNYAQNAYHQMSYVQPQSPNCIPYGYSYQKVSTVSIIGCIFDLLALLVLPFLSLVGIACGLIDITAKDSYYKHGWGWVSLIAGGIILLEWIIRICIFIG